MIAAHSDRLLGLCILMALAIVGAIWWLWLILRLEADDEKSYNAAIKDLDDRYADLIFKVGAADHAKNMHTHNGGHCVDFTKK